MKKPVKSVASKQSYITGPVLGSKKAVLIVAVSESMASKQNKDHKDVIDEIYAQLLAKGTFDKAHALQIRSQILS